MQAARSPQKHAPERQVSAESPQSFPQRPQLSMLVWVSTQTPEQQEPPPQRLLQTPQCAVLVEVSTQEPSQQT